MIQKFMLIMAQLIRGFGIVIIYCGLLLIAVHYFTWGVAALLIGLAALGFNEEGWS